MDVFCTVIDIISVYGSIPIEIPILWPRAVMVGPRPRVLLTLPLDTGLYGVTSLPMMTAFIINAYHGEFIIIIIIIINWQSERIQRVD